MADNTIDTLALEVSSNAGRAVDSIERLATSLGKVGRSINMINVSKFGDLSNGIDSLSQAMLNFSKNVKTADFTRVATGLGKIAAVNSSQIIYASDAIKTLGKEMQAINGLKIDSEEFSKLANSIAKLGRGTVTQAAKNIPEVAKEIGTLQLAMKAISDTKYDVTPLANLTSAISRLGGKTALAAPENINKLAVALKDMMKTLSTAPQVSQNLINMTNALANLASNGNRTASASRSLVTGLNNYSGSAKRAKSQTFSLASAIGKLYASYWIVLRAMGMFKKAINISADLTEVQNVVNQTFGDFASKIEDLSQNSIQNLGMSELTVKQISSRYQAMGTAMGFTQGKMADMSVELTKLAADMASFYNVEQAVVAEDLESIFTGSTRPLRQYGLDLTQATLQEWALKNGIDANVQSMSQAEKTMLRYQYVMAQTKVVSGDFAATANTWSNQVRILQQSFAALGGIVGGTLVNAFKPFLSALNTVMQKVISFARTVANALGAIFGWTIEIDAGGIASDFEAAEDSLGGAADTSGGVADNIADANKNAEKLKKTVMSFDQLHQLADITKNASPNSGSGGSGGGAGGGGGSADGASANIVRRNSLLTHYESEIKSLEQLGSKIGSSLAVAMSKINWASVYQKANNFGVGFASFLNGLISPSLFGETGKLIASSLNTALIALNGFGVKFDWSGFGRSIAAGINRFFKTFSFTMLANDINTWAHGILDTMITAVENINWSEIGVKISGFISKIDWSGLLKKVGKLVWEALTGSLKALSNMFDASPIETGILAGIALLKFPGVKDTLIALLKSKVFGATASSGSALSVGTVGLNFTAKLGQIAGIQAIGKGLTDLIASKIGDEEASSIVEAVGNGMTNFATIGWAFGGPGGAIAGALFGGIISYISTAPEWEEVRSKIQAGIDKITETITVLNEKTKNYLTIETDSYSAMGEVLRNLAEEAGITSEQFGSLNDRWVQASVSGDEFKFFASGIIEDLGDMGISSQKFATMFQASLTGLGVPVEEQKKALENLGFKFDDVTTSVANVSTGVGGLGGLFDTLGGSPVTNALKVALVSAALGLLQEKAGLSDEEISDLNTELTNASTSTNGLSDVFYKIANRLDLAGVSAADMYNAMKTGAESVVTDVPEQLNTLVGSIDTFAENVESSMLSAGGNVTSGMAKGITDGLGEVETATDGLVSAVTETTMVGLGINSPSTVATNYGKFYDQGLANGLSLYASLVTSACNTVVASMKNVFSSQSLYALFQYYGGQYMTYLKAGFNAGDDAVLTEAGNIAGKIKNKFSSSSAYSGYGSNYMNALKNGLANGASGKNNLYSKAEDIAKGVLSRFSMYDSMYSKGQSAARGFKNGITSIKIPTPHIQPTGSMKYVLGNSSFSVPTWGVNWYKSGGLFDAASIIGVGEAGREAVLPLENRKTMKMIADSILNNSFGGMINSKMIADAVERGVVTAMMNNAHNQQPINVYATLQTEDNEVLARAVAKGQKSIDYRKNPVPSY